MDTFAHQNPSQVPSSHTFFASEAVALIKTPAALIEPCMITIISSQDLPLKLSGENGQRALIGPLDTFKFAHVNTVSTWCFKALPGVLQVSPDRIRVEQGLYLEGPYAGCPYAKVLIDGIAIDGVERETMRSLLRLIPLTLTPGVKQSTDAPADHILDDQQMAELQSISKDIILTCHNQVIPHEILLLLGDEVICSLKGRFHKKPDLSNYTPELEVRSLRFNGQSKSGEEIHFIGENGSKVNAHVGKKEFSAQEIGKYMDSKDYFLVTMSVTTSKTGKRLHVLVDFEKDTTRAPAQDFTI